MFESRNSIKLNPELEALRAKALEESTVESNNWITSLIKKTSYIHAGFLFEDLKTLQNLCLYIGETQNNICNAGWETFGYYLGLGVSLLKVINHNNFSKEDPCYNVLLAYVQNEKATIGNVLKALHEMGRIDVLSRIKHSIQALADIILQYNNNGNNNTIEDTSDYESLPTSEGCSQSCDSSFTFFESDNIFIRPKVIPPAPFIFQNIKENPELTSKKIQQALKEITLPVSLVNSNENNYKKDIEPICSSQNPLMHCLKETSLASNINNNRTENLKLCKKKKYSLKIFLTFAEDGENYAKEIAKILRKKFDNYLPMGVLILSEHSELVNSDPQQFIEGAFHQVDYICPIITPQYYKLITKQEKVNLYYHNSLDAVYVPYIFRLMNSYFISNDCLNDKIRCIIPENTFLLVPRNFLFTNPIFGAWVSITDVNDMALRLLKSHDKEIIENKNSL